MTKNNSKPMVTARTLLSSSVAPKYDHVDDDDGGYDNRSESSQGLLKSHIESSRSEVKAMKETISIPVIHVQNHGRGAGGGVALGSVTPVTPVGAGGSKVTATTFHPPTIHAIVREPSGGIKTENSHNKNNATSELPITTANVESGMVERTPPSTPFSFASFVGEEVVPAVPGADRKHQEQYSNKYSHNQRGEGANGIDMNVMVASVAADKKMAEKKKNRRIFRLEILSNLFFILGSVLYLIVAIDVYNWAIFAQSVPEVVLRSTDDLIWEHYALGRNVRGTLPPTSIERLSSNNDNDNNDTNNAGVRNRQLRQRSLQQQQQQQQQQQSPNAYDHTINNSVQRFTQEGEWNQLYWHELPQYLQQAGTVLGYDQDTWDNNITISAEDLFWDELTEEQQDAATLFGYSQTTWDDATDATTAFEPDILDMPENSDIPDSMFLPTSTNDHSNTQQTNNDQETPITLFQDIDAPTTLFQDTSNNNLSTPTWSELPQNYREAATILGYNQTIWDNGLTTHTHTLSWNQLTGPQQEAAATFGYDEQKWNSSGDYNTHVTTPIVFDVNTSNFRNFTWSELPLQVRAAASLLGYDQTTWDNNLQPLVTALDWQSLTAMQQQAVDVIGLGTPPNTTTTTTTTTNNANDTNNGLSDNDKNSVETADPAHWRSYQWAELPPDIQAAAILLGYNSVIWNNDFSAFTNGLDWYSLTTVQQEAATTLGYNSELWDRAHGFATTNSTDTTTTTDWDDYWWVELPDNVRDAATILGYSQNSWDNDLPVDTEDLYWSDLTQQQQDAAAVFGYNQEKWDSADVSSSDATVWYNSYWNQLPEDVKAAAMVLGYDENIWDDKLGSFVDDLKWDELTIDQKNAAIKIGYSEETWGTNVEVGVVADSSPEQSNKRWDDYYWSELPENIQAAFEVLGYTENAWNYNLGVYTDILFWKDLSVQQQEAAAIIGYNQKTWDEEDENYYAPWDDSYIYQLPNGAWVTREMMITFSAASCFVFVGFIDMSVQKSLINLLMVIAGMFGVLQAMFIEKNLNLSNIFGVLSVHFFLFEGISVMRNRKHIVSTYVISRSFNYALSIADGSFFVGALLDVVISYFYLRIEATWNIVLAIVLIFGAALWLFCSMIYLATTITLRRMQVTKDRQQYNGFINDNHTNIMNKPANGDKHAIVVSPTATSLSTKSSL